MSILGNLSQVIRAFPTSAPLTDDAWRELSTALPERITFSELITGISSDLGDTISSCNPDSRTAVVAILACLNKGPEREPEDDVSIRRLCDYVATAIAPCSTEEGGQDADADEESPDYDEVALRSREIAVYGLKILRALTLDYSSSSSSSDAAAAAPIPILLSDAALLTVISFTDLSDPWTTPDAHELATSLLERQLSGRRSGSNSNSSSSSSSNDDLPQQEFLVEYILKTYLRPLFSKSRPKTVTASGRKAEFPDEHDPHRGLSDETRDVKPWKYVDHRVITVFSWTVQNSDEILISKQWPLFIPVILTLLDDGATRIRSRSLVILDVFLSKFPDHILRDTGLASVFEESVFPTLHFLPSITPEVESIQLLGPAYSTLLTLATKLDVKAKTGPHHGSTPRAKLLDKILRDGVFPAYFHAKDHVRIVEVLLVQTAKVLNKMGIHAVKHLKDLIPMYSEIMTNPFAPLAPLTLLAAIQSLQATITNCWPRLSTPAYQNELIKSLIVCFLTVHDDSDKLGTQFATIEAELVNTAAMLSAAMKSNGGEGGNTLQDKVIPLIAKEPLLEKLFR